MWAHCVVQNVSTSWQLSVFSQWNCPHLISGHFWMLLKSEPSILSSLVVTGTACILFFNGFPKSSVWIMAFCKRLRKIHGCGPQTWCGTAESWLPRTIKFWRYLYCMWWKQSIYTCIYIICGMIILYCQIRSEIFLTSQQLQVQHHRKDKN